MPILFALTMIYKCSYGLDKNLDHKLDISEVFLDLDCSKQCFSTTHIITVIVASISLLAYIPLVILVCPHWQELQGNILHIKWQSWFIIIKNSIQVSLVVLNQLLRSYYPQVYAIIYSVLFFIIAILILLKKPLTYNKINWLLFVSYTSISFISTLIAISINSSEKTREVLLIVLLVGLLLCIIVGITITVKFPKLLKQIEPDLVNLFRFGFKLKANINILQEHVKNMNQRVQIERNSLVQNVRETVDKKYNISKRQELFLKDLTNAKQFISINQKEETKIEKTFSLDYTQSMTDRNFSVIESQNSVFSKVKNEFILKQDIDFSNSTQIFQKKLVNKFEQVQIKQEVMYSTDLLSEEEKYKQ